MQNDQHKPINDNCPPTIHTTKAGNFNKNIELICRQKNSSKLFISKKELTSNISATPINLIHTTKISYLDSTREVSNFGTAPSILPNSSSKINISFKAKEFCKLDVAMACSASWPVSWELSKCVFKTTTEMWYKNWPPRP